MVIFSPIHWVHTPCDLEMIDYPPYSPDLTPSIFCSPTWRRKKNLTDRWWGHNYLQLRTFSRIRVRAFIPREFKHCNTDGRRVWTGRGDSVEKYAFGQIRPLHDTLPVNFSQPTLVNWFNVYYWFLTNLHGSVCQQYWLSQPFLPWREPSPALLLSHSSDHPPICWGLSSLLSRYHDGSFPKWKSLDCISHRERYKKHGIDC